MAAPDAQPQWWGGVMRAGALVLLVFAIALVVYVGQDILYAHVHTHVD
jgi:hypothetical protein